MENYIVRDRLVSVNVLEVCETFERHFSNMEVRRNEEKSNLLLWDLGTYVDAQRILTRYRPISIDSFLNLLAPKKDGRVCSGKLSSRLSANVAFVKDASGVTLPVCARRVSRDEELRNQQSPFIELCPPIPGRVDSHWRMEILTDYSQWWSYARLVSTGQTLLGRLS